MIFRPATPGFLVTLTATVLLAVVSFNVPILKSVFFLKASLTVENVNGNITLGTLGYCIELSNGTTCSSPSVGYEFDPNKLLGDNISFAQIPTVVVKWITYALFLHVIALCAAALSALFGLLAHVREMSMSCFSSCISGFAAVITLVAFIFDLVLFFLAKSRINSVANGSATMGSAIWLTLAAWLLLFFSGCVYACGRCCVSRRPRGSNDDPRLDNSWMGRFGMNRNNDYGEQMRLEAVKAEADRKARQHEIGLPAFPERDVTRPLNNKPQYLEEESDEEGSTPYKDDHVAGGLGAGMPGGYNGRQGTGQNFRGGYAQATPGTRAVDEYYSPTQTGQKTSSAGSPPPSNYSRSNYAPSTYSSAAPTNAPVTSPPPQNQFLAVGGQAGHTQYPSGREYGHANSGTTYHTAASSQHQQYPSQFSQYNDPYSTQGQSSFNPETYNNTAIIPGTMPAPGHAVSPPPRQPSVPIPQPQTYTPPPGAPPAQSYDYYGYGSGSGYGNNVLPDPSAGAVGVAVTSGTHQPERSYTLGGGGYGANIVPDSTAYNATATGYATDSKRAFTASPPAALQPAINTNVAAQSGMTSPNGPRPQREQSYAYGVTSQPSHGYEDSPPGYDAGPSQAAPSGGWDSKQPR